MKRKQTLLLFMLIAVLLVGCGQDATSTVPSPTATTAVPAATAPSADATATVSTPTIAATATSSTAATATSAAPAPTDTTTTAATATPAASASTEDTTPKVVAAATAFLATLTDAERAATLFAWTDTAQKQRWSNLPNGLYTRAGLMWGDMTDAQQQAWLAVMAATLSSEGYNRVIAEWNADEALAAQQSSGGGGGQQLMFGKKYYFVAIIGTPSATDPWMWQWGGHHVTVNATVVGSNISLTPSFIGVQPATYTDASGNTVRPLGDIEDLAFALVGSLDATEQKAAILGSTAIDLVLGPGQDGKTLQSEGLPAAQMTANQQAMLLTLIGKYTNLLNDEDAAARMADIQANLAVTTFAWYGPTTEGSSSYFRITGPTVVIEYSPQQGGGQASAVQGPNHIHGIYRDPTNEYGSKYTP